jgi:uncharacterized membrane protein
MPGLVRKPAALFALAAGLLVLAAPARALEKPYTLTNLSSGQDVDGGSISGTVAYAINEKGDITGATYFGSTSSRTAYLWRASTRRFTNLGKLPGAHSLGWDLNDDDVVVGQSDNGLESQYGSSHHATVWRPAEPIFDLGTFGSSAPTGDCNEYDCLSAAYGISNDNNVVGHSLSYHTRAQGQYCWCRNPFLIPDAGVKPRQMQYPLDDIQNTDGTGDSIAALDVNSRGQVVFDAFFGDSQSNDGALYPGNIRIPFQVADRHPLNDNGQVVGRVFGSGPAKLYPGDVTLPPLPGHTFSSASSINNKGDVVGTSSGNSGCPSAVIWRKSDYSKPIDLNKAIPGNTSQLWEAVDINEKGQIVAEGTPGACAGSAQLTGFLLEPPAPAEVDVDLQPVTVGDNDLFDLRMTVRHSGTVNTPDLVSFTYQPGNGLSESSPFGPAAALVPIFGPAPGFPSTLVTGQLTEHYFAYSVEGPGKTLMQAYVKAVDAYGDEHEDAAAVLIDATLKTGRQDVDGLIAGGLISLMDTAVTTRERLAAKLSDIVHKQLKGSKGTKGMLKPTDFERNLARRFGLPDDGLAWLPNRTKSTGSGPAREPSNTEVALAFMEATGTEMKKVGIEAADRTLVTPFVFWRDYLFEPAPGDRAKVTMEMVNLASDGVDATTGVLGEAAHFYTSPAEMQAAWTEMPKITAEAQKKLAELDQATTDAILQWDDLMKKDPVKGAKQFGKLLGRIEGEVAVGWLENIVGGKVSQGLKTFKEARAGAQITSEVSEQTMNGRRLAAASKGAKPVAKTPSLGNLSETQIQRFQAITKRLSEKFGIKIEIQARPINEFAAKVKGGIGKVEAVPTKNLTPDDVLLGAPEEYLGQTAYYRPVKPKNFSKLSKDVQERLGQRIKEKGKELDQFLGKTPDPTGKADKVRKALKKGGAEFELGKNGKVVMELEKTTHKSGAILIRYKKLSVNGKAVFTGKPRPIVSDVDMNALIDSATGKHLPAGIRGQAELELMREFSKAAEEGVFPFGYHGWTHSGFDIAGADFRHILKYQLMYMSDDAAKKLAAKYAKIYGVKPEEFLDGYTKGKMLVKITPTSATLGPGAGG